MVNGICEHCHGNQLMMETDESHQTYVFCLQCGWRHYLARPAEKLVMGGVTNKIRPAKVYSGEGKEDY